MNICPPPIVERHGIVSVDTDLDVIGWLDGSVEVVDRDQFEDHQVRYSYPVRPCREHRALVAMPS